MFHLFKKKEKIKKELPPGTIRKEFHFEGNVQNIGFRFEVQSHAKPLGITGYAKNNEDGSVTAQLQGSLEDINRVILSLQNIDRIQIDSITSKEIPLDYYEKDFSIIY
ncbi:MAG: acylphosphatase [Solobacterium sp.]|jgi:acylphosphatase|uniref:acylphosphatase n=2 Tax=Holdemanella porci TaxID=2652276 RepID=UPI000E4D0F00|nr:acylphosphatase [Holdemanella porci]MBD9044196.1 acylphosphatase [Solobacterium sp.]MBD9216421.1 acylphosphatase [Solobacterium sp.]RHE41114.1 acylphosphatase [Eubacterium sp. AM28-29]